MSKRNIGRILSFVITLSVILFYYHEILLNPQAYLTCDNGDGIKSFYVFADHIKNDTSYNQMANMNYPYGQTHIFTDGQTGIANIIKWLSEWIPSIKDYSISIINLLMLFSFPICSFFLCLIIERLNIPLLFTVLGAVVITLLSPQLFRMTSHCTLSYVFFFPFSWWLFICWNESKKFKYVWSTGIAANSIFWFFVHPYYIMISCIFYALYLVLGLLESSSQKIIWKHTLPAFAIQVILPLVITRLYIHGVDFHVERPESPGGFWDYYARLNTVFMPHHLPFKEIFYYFFSNHDQEWEGWAYIGLPSVFIALYIIVKILRYLFKKQFRKIFLPAIPAILKVALWAAVLELLFSMCIPFRWNLRFIVDWFPFIKQFRSLGRFAWVFYYVFNVYALYILYLSYRFLKIKKLNLAAYSFVIVFFSLFFSEAHVYHKEVSESSIKGINYFHSRYLPGNYKTLISKVQEIKYQYQCLIPFPFYHAGSENFEKETADIITRMSMVTSYWTNFPLLSSSSARSSIPEAKNIMQFFSPPWFDKAIEKDLPSKKDFLILYSKEWLNKVEDEWLSKSQKIYEDNTFELYSLPYDQVFNKKISNEINNFNSARDSLTNINNLFYSKNADTVIYDGFDNRKSSFIYSGAGAIESMKNDYTILLPRKSYNLKNDKDYIISFWYYNKDELRNQCACILEECDADGNNCRWDISWSPVASMVIDGNWSLVQKQFRLKNNNSQIAVLLNGDKYSKQKIFVDELLIRENGTDVFQIKKEGIVKNNVLLQK
jgi:hypothetical protein